MSDQIPIEDVRPTVLNHAFKNEADFQRHVRKVAEANGWKVHCVWRSDHSPAGWPDLVMVKGDRMLIMELKMPKGKLTDKQREWLNLLMQVRVVRTLAVVRPTDLDWLTEILEGSRE